MAKYGIHTPELTTRLMNKIKSEVKHKITDVSYGNDTCDSFQIEGTEHPKTGLCIHIFLPNSDETDSSNEEWSTFSINPLGYAEGDGITLSTVEEVIEYINKI